MSLEQQTFSDINLSAEQSPKQASQSASSGSSISSELGSPWASVGSSESVDARLARQARERLAVVPCVTITRRDLEEKAERVVEGNSSTPTESKSCEPQVVVRPSRPPKVSVKDFPVQEVNRRHSLPAAVKKDFVYPSAEGDGFQRQVKRGKRVENKHLKHNFRKSVERAESVAREQSQKSEPEPAVGSSVPNQWAVDVSKCKTCDAEAAQGKDICDWCARFQNYTSTCLSQPESKEEKMVKEAQKEKPVWTPSGTLELVGKSDARGSAGYRSVNDEPRVVIQSNAQVDNRLIEYHERRVIFTDLKEYRFPRVLAMGLWSSAKFSKDAQSCFAEQSAAVLVQGDYFIVSLPYSLVDELISWWSHRIRDDKEENFRLSVAKCKKLISELALSPEILKASSLYAPAIAYYKSWDEQQNASHAVRGDYWSRAPFLRTIEHNRSAYREGGILVKSIYIAGAIVAVGSLAGGLYGVFRLNKSLRMQYVTPSTSSAYLMGKRRPYLSITYGERPISKWLEQFFKGSAVTTDKAIRTLLVGGSNLLARSIKCIVVYSVGALKSVVNDLTRAQRDARADVLIW